MKNFVCINGTSEVLQFNFASPSFNKNVWVPAQATYEVPLPDGNYDFTLVDKDESELVFYSITIDNGAFDGFAAVPSTGGIQVFAQELKYQYFSSEQDVPGLGTITLPDWALVNPEMGVFFLGLAAASGIKLIRAALRWFRKADGYDGVTE